MFKEVNVSELDNIDKSKFENYFVEDELKHDRLFKFENYYIGLTEIDQVAFIDIICLEGKINILTECFKLSKQLFKEYEFLGFSFQNWKSKILVNRIIKNYKTVYESVENGNKIIIFKEVESE